MFSMFSRPTEHIFDHTFQMSAALASGDAAHRDSILTLRLRRFVFAVVSLPLCAFISCVIISLCKDFEEVNRTHCKVYNFLPSISSSIGNNSPQTYIWRLGVAFHLTPRLILAFSYYGWYRKLDHNRWRYDSAYRRLCKCSLVFHIAEIACLAGLTFLSSSENFSIHEKSFIGFAICSWLYMVTTCMLFRMQKTKWLSTTRLKCWILSVFCMAVLGISYTYWRHNAYCEPYVYSMFALFEYITVLCNMAFHTTAAWDFKDYAVLVSSTKGLPGVEELL
ncbi:LOW QUALITY PROTEIN: post-GPI attachment to proteins factor 2-like [Amphiura filiformis]|uniref:LOW QUALITY PROTEIN: post-GPI attachment to proteins factor 2-like n=1 Tax=Amphiura filiformis TaxID=82378 RepID=UPI003B21381A